MKRILEDASGEEELSEIIQIVNPIRKWEKLKKFGKKVKVLRKFNITKADSPIWKKYLPFRGTIKTNGKKGNNKEYYEWDYTHNDIEVYNHNGVHKGSLNPKTGFQYKGPVDGRTIDI